MTSSWPNHRRIKFRRPRILHSVILVNKSKTQKNMKKKSQNTEFVCSVFGELFHQTFAEIFAHPPGRYLTRRIFPQQTAISRNCRSCSNQNNNKKYFYKFSLIKIIAPLCNVMHNGQSPCCYKAIHYCRNLKSLL